MALAAIGEAPVANSELQGKRAALTVFSEVQVVRGMRPTGQEKPHLHEEHSEVPRFKTTTDCGRSWLVRTTEDFTVEPRCRQIATGRLEVEKGESLPSLVCVEPALIPIQGVLPARVLTRVETITPPSLKVTSQPGFANRDHVVVANFNDEPLTIPKLTVIGVAELISEKVVNLVKSGGESVAKLLTVPCRKKINEALYNKLLRGKLDHSPKEERRLIETVLLKYAHDFRDEYTNDFKATDVVEHDITVER